MQNSRARVANKSSPRARMLRGLDFEGNDGFWLKRQSLDLLAPVAHEMMDSRSLGMC